MVSDSARRYWVWLAEGAYAVAAFVPPGLYAFDHFQSYSTGGGPSSTGFLLGLLFPVLSVPLLLANHSNKTLVIVSALIGFSPVPFALYQVMTQWHM